MRVTIATPAPRGSSRGNRVTALRWSRILRGLGHRVRVTNGYDGLPCDVLIALHARKSAAAVARFRRLRPRGGLIVALVGTDLYVDLKRRNPRALRSIEAADRLVTLQPLAVNEVPKRLRAKVRTIVQSVARVSVRPAGRAREAFVVAVVGHLRTVKDPFRAALAARELPESSRIAIAHAGSALTPAMARRARAEMERNPRYHWLGALRPLRVRALLGFADAFVLSSRSEGGANALGEAIVAGVPVLASRIAGSIGLLGRGYPGYFAPGGTAALTRLLERVETNRAFRARLRRGVSTRSRLFAEGRERAAWRALLKEMTAA
jgi:putative glycosyltransferase (TIGR04348 family)